MAREMKDSGVAWIGDVPFGWTTTKMKSIGSYINGYPFKPEQWSSTGKMIIRIQDLTGSNDNPNYFNDTIDSRYTVCAGDMLISWAATLDAFIWQGEDGWLNQHIFKAIPNESIIKKDFFFWLIKVAMANMNNENKHGIMMQHVTLGVFNNFSIPLPPYDEQHRIADFLDRKCAEIDRVVAETEKSIEEYKRLKKSVITEAVTKGIRGDRPKRDSGSIWFGWIPVEWETSRIKHLFHIKKNIAGSEGYTVLSITQRGIRPKDISNNEGQVAENYSNYQLVAPGDYAMNHMDLLTGWVDVSSYQGVTSPDYRVFVLNDCESNSKKYYLYMMQMCYFNRIFYGLGAGVSGMGRWRLQADKFLNFLVPVPPIQEQDEIAQYLAEKCTEIDRIIETKQQLLTELSAYKKSFIYEYVTGKTEVPVCQ